MAMTGGDAAAEWAFPNRATPPGSSAYYCVRFAPPGQRALLAALFGWRGEVRGVLRVSDPGVARLKLDWWREEAARIAGCQPRHPLGQAMVAGCGGRPLPVAPMLALIDGVEARLRRLPLVDDEAWWAAQAADLGAFAEIFFVAAAAEGPTSPADAHRAGAWCAGVRALRDAGRHLREGRVVLPTPRLAAAGLTQTTLASPDGRSRLPELLAPLAEQLVARTASRRDLATLPKVLRAQVRIHGALLRELRASALAVADQRIGLTPVRKLIIAWGA